MTDPYVILLLVSGWSLLAGVATHAAYSNGLADGYRACQHPDDPLWNRVRQKLKKMGVV